MIKTILFGILSIILIIGIFFLLSRLQMKAWLIELEQFLNNKFDKSIKSKEDGTKEKK